MPIGGVFRDPVVRAAWKEFRSRWRAMAGWTAAVWTVELAVLVPLSGLLLGRLLIRGDRAVIGNVELAAWLLSPLGLTYLVVGGALAAFAAGLRYAGIFHIVNDGRRGRPVSLRRTALHVLLQAPRVLKLCLAAAGSVLAATLPLAAGLFVIHEAFLGRHGLGYYLEVAPSPPEWKAALAAGAAWALAWAAAVLGLSLRLAPAVPAALEGRPLRNAARESWGWTAGEGVRILKAVALSALTWIAVRAAFDSGLFRAAGLIVVGAGLSLDGMIFASAVYLVIAFALDAVLSFVGFSFVSVLVTRFYCEYAGPPGPRPKGAEAPRRAARAARSLESWLRPRRVVLLLAVLGAAAVAVAVGELGRSAGPVDFVITAHRGAGKLAPENTLAAIERGIAAGADRVEIDIQRTQDGVLVAFHDADLRRVAGDPGRIRDMTYQEIAALDVGSWFHPDFAGERVPTLEQCMEATRGRVGLTLELKYYGFDADLAEDCLRRVRARGMEREVVFTSLYPRAVQQMKRLAPEIPVGYLSILSAGDVRRLEADFVGVPYVRATPALFRAARSRGLPIHVGGANRPARMITAVERGAAGLTTDTPDVAARLRAELRELSPAEWLLLRFRKVWEDPGEETEIGLAISPGR